MKSSSPFWGGLAALAIAVGAAGACSNTEKIFGSPKPKLVKIVLSPDSVAVDTGATVQFSVSAKWDDSSNTIPPFSLIASGGTFDLNTGRYIAPSAAGTYFLLLSADGGWLVGDTTRIVVTQPPPPPAPSFTPNLPSGVGLTLITDTKFSTTLASAGLTGEYDFRMSNVPDAPEDQGVFEIFYPGNSFGNGGGGAQLYGPQNRNWRRVYFSMMMWVSPNYSVHSNQEKWFYPLVRTAGFSTSSCEFAWRPNPPETPNGWSWSAHFDSQLPGDVAKYPVNNVPFRKGVWQLVEMYAVMNTPGNLDGEWKLWIDGVLSVNLTGIRCSDKPVQSGFDGIRFTGTRGGGASNTPTPPEGQVRRYSRLAFYATPNP